MGWQKECTTWSLPFHLNLNALFRQTWYPNCKSIGTFFCAFLLCPPSSRSLSLCLLLSDMRWETRMRWDFCLSNPHQGWNHNEIASHEARGEVCVRNEGNIGWQRLWKQDARLLYDFEPRECTLIDQTTKVIGQLCFSKFRLEFALWVRQRRCPCLFFLSISFVFPSSSNLICFVDCEEERHRRQFDWSNISSIELFFFLVPRF